MFSSLMLSDVMSDYLRYGLSDNPYDDYYGNLAHKYLDTKPRQVGSSKQLDSKSESDFKVMLNVKHFKPNEIDVKTVDNFVVIHGKHEEYADEHGFISREFARRYQLPDNVQPDKVTSSLCEDGVLTIKAPRKIIEPPKNERIVPIAIQKSLIVEETEKLLEQQRKVLLEYLQKQQQAEAK